jgi:hypothetical protein
MARKRSGFSCRSCGAPLSFDETGPACSACSRPAVTRALRTVRAYARDSVAPAPIAPAHGPDLCEDAPACAVCRETMGLPPTLPGLG